MSNYIRIPMVKTSNGIGGSFYAYASFKLDHISTRFINVDVKIDTGCSISTIPLKRIWGSTYSCYKLKEKDISDNIPYCVSYGVETGGQIHKPIISKNDKLNSNALKFKHEIYDFEINGVKLDSKNIYVNYNRESNILIGMDILKDWDIHIGKLDGITTLVACPYYCINDDYLVELSKFNMKWSR